MGIRKKRDEAKPPGLEDEKQGQDEQQEIAEEKQPVNKPKAKAPKIIEEEYEPVLVYRSPGPHQAPGGTFEYMQICTPENGEAALKEGWCLTVEDAVKKAALQKKS